MALSPARLSMVFSCLGHAYMHMFTAFYFVIVLALEQAWMRPYHELIELWTLGAVLVGLGAIPAGWMGDRWSAAGMMVVFYLGLGGSAIACAFLDTPQAMLVGLAAIGFFSSIYHPVGIAWLVQNATKRGAALGINGVFGSVGVAGSALIAGTLVDLYGWQAAFLVPGVVCLMTGVALLAAWRLGFVDDDRRERVEEARPATRDMLRVFAILALTMFMTGLVFNATQVAMPKAFDLRLRDLTGDGLFGIGAMVALVYLVGGLMQLAGGFLADRFPLKPLYILSFLFQVPVLALVAVLAGLPLIVAAMMAVVLSAAALPAENMLLARYTPQRHRSLAYGVKFVLAFGTAPLALQLAAIIEGRTGEFVWLFTLLAAFAAVSTLAALMLPGPLWRQPVPAAAE